MAAHINTPNVIPIYSFNHIKTNIKTGKNIYRYDINNNRSFLILVFIKLSYVLFYLMSNYYLTVKTN